MIWLYLIFLVVLVELGIFFQLGNLFGVWITLTIIASTAVVGILLIRWQSIRISDKIVGYLKDRKNLSPIPAIIATDGSILLGCLLLIFPGFATDTLGVLLFFPPIHKSILRRLELYNATVDKKHCETATVDGLVIDGEYEEVTTHPQPPQQQRWSENISNHN
ncbi:MAG: FxsA family protein [Aestuariivita sp.]|nr:FxsA family protein [Aestuariivita sp.]MCY4202577.1 FxsA family protein [Aestuariivita sp.]